MSSRSGSIVAVVSLGLAWGASLATGCRAALAAEPVPTAAAAPGGAERIRGRVVGAPPWLEVKVAYALAEEDPDDEHTVPCAPDGSFVIDGLDPALPAVPLTALGAATEPCWIVTPTLSPPVWAAPGASEVELRVPPAATYHLRIVDAASGAPLEGVQLGWLEGGEVRMGDRPCAQRTSAPGEYALEVVFLEPSATCAVRVTHPGGPSVALGGRTFVPGESHDLGTVALEPPRTVLVRVCDDRDGSPVAGARLALTPASRTDCLTCALGASWPARSELAQDVEATTGADGRARLEVARGQSYSLVVEHDGFPARCETLSTDARAPAEVVVSLESGGALVVTCLDADSFVPLANETIACARGGAFSGWRDERTLATGADGRARFANLAAGMYRFWPAELEPDEAAREIEVFAGEERALTLTRPTPLDGLLYGIVREAGRPLVGARVTLGEEQTLTDAEGVYEFRGLAREELALAVTHPRFGPVLARRVTLTRADTRLDLALELAPIEGRVSDADGRPLAGVTLALGERAADGAIEAQLGPHSLEPLCATTSDADGRFRFAAVAARDDLALVVERRGYFALRLAGLTIPPDGAPLVLAPVLERAETLAVVVPAELAGRASVRAVWRGERTLPPVERVLRAAPDGRGAGGAYFLFEDLHAGPWTIELEDPTRAGRPLARAEVSLPRADKTPLELRP